MYADEMGRQVEACHFCIHLRRGRRRQVGGEDLRFDAPAS